MSIQDTTKSRVTAAIKTLFGSEFAELAAEVPPRTELGDLAFPFAFELAKQLKAATGQKQNPRELASQVAAAVADVPGISRVEVAGAGYLNIFFDRARYLLAALAGPEKVQPVLGGKLIVEHTAVNPNKAAHIGHLRNAVLGDTIVRLLKSAGEQVEIQNYIDNTGVQVADVVVGFKYMEGKSLDEVRAIQDKFDYYCWDLYARVAGFYEEDKPRLELRSTVLHELEKGTGEISEMADYIATRILNCHLDTMLRLGIQYDLLPRESEILHQHIWQYAFEVLKQRGAIVYETEGRLAGCWVMRAEDRVEDSAEESEHEADKVIVRSNGTVTYTGKDIAFHLWKLGQLDLDFFYKPFRHYPDGHVAWITTPTKDDNDSAHPRFGKASAYFNVIDISQQYPQHYVKLGVMAVDNDERAQRSAHVAYERVVLSAAAAAALGQELSEQDRAQATVAMSGRKGLGVKIDDMLDQLEAGALVEVSTRHPELDGAEQRANAHKIAVAALRYFLLKYTRTSVISFDFKEALAFEGETGPYIQYSIARANSIFRKMRDAGLSVSPSDIETVPRDRIIELLSGKQGDQLWALVYLANRLPDMVRVAISNLEPAVVAKWAFQTAQAFAGFYNDPANNILHEPDPPRRALLVAIAAIVRHRLIEALALLGIEAPDQM
jgi:arginyl-tRNA synthetase